MQILSNPPLKQVTFNIWWHLYSMNDIGNSKYLVGDLYNEIKAEYPQRKSLGRKYSPKNLNSDNLVTEFSKTENLWIEFSNDSCDLMSTNEGYNWDSYNNEINFLSDRFIPILKSTLEPDHIHIGLEYVNFLSFDSSESDVLSYIKNSLQLNVIQNFYTTNENPNMVDFSFRYKAFDKSSVHVHITSGKYDGTKGIIARFKVDSGKEDCSESTIRNWSNKAHQVCEEIFLKMYSNLMEEFK